ncbi:uncharacterized protein LOC128864379 [Anastrepha ludens]|uniref:uncharacterized protein LOC128864379 n=1 Tax=Anastrepha ludens TaxID=28586 RepID=UPI0023AEC357|nr:uncharacterized protein LOC128864379 [Anastrepha ludens]
MLLHLNKRCVACIFTLFLCFAFAQEELSASVTTTTTGPTTVSSINAADISSSSPSTTTTTTTDTVSATARPARAEVVGSGSDKQTAGSTAQPKKYFTLDDNIPVCKNGSPEFNNCVKNLLQVSLLRVQNGDKELNIPVIDPFRLNRTTFQYSNGNVRGRIIMRDALIYGFSKLDIKTLDLKVVDGKITMKALSNVPEIRIVGNYKAEFTLSNVQLRPRGQFNVSLVDVNIGQTYEGGFYDADGHRFVRMTKFDADPKVNDFKFLASGVFPDPTLNELAVNIINQYWRQIFQAFLPETRKYWGPMLLQQINDIMSVVPYDVFVVN